MVSNSVLDEMHLVIYMYAFVCCSWCACLQVCVSILVSRGDFSVFLLPRRCNHILAPSQWQLVGMHIVIKQFPVCKCPVYTSLLQSLSLDRLLEYEESSYTMKNENSKTSIKKNLLCPLSALDILETDVTGKIRSFTRPHAHNTYKLQNDQGHYSQQPDDTRWWRKQWRSSSLI